MMMTTTTAIRITVVVVVALGTAIGVRPCFGQDLGPEVAKIASIADEAEAERRIQDLFRGSALVQAAMGTARERARLRAERGGNADGRLRAGSARMFREIGSTNLRGGASSAVAKTSATEFLAMALESGSVTGKTDKSSATFQLNALPTWQLMTGRGAPYGCGGLQTRMAAATGVCESGVGFWLRGLTGSVSFNVNSKETAVPVLSTTATSSTGNQTVATGIQVLNNPSKLSAVGAKYELFQREHDPKKQAASLVKIAETLNASLASSGLALKLVGAMDKVIRNDDGSDRKEYKEWFEKSVDGAKPIRKDRVALERFVRGRLDLMVDQLMSVGGFGMAEEFAGIQGAYDEYVSSMAKLEAEQLFKKSLAFDFVHSRPSDQP